MAAADPPPGVSARAARGRPRNVDHDAAILDAAIDLLIERGPDAASIEAIARRAGVAKLTVYRRWTSKEELLIAAIDHVRVSGPEASDPGMSGPNASGPSAFGPDADVEDAIRAMAAQLDRPRYRELMARVIGATVDRPELVRAYAERHLQPRLDALREVVERAVDAGDFPAGSDPETIRDALFGVVLSVLYPPVPTRSEVESRMRRLVVQLGYRPQRAAAPT